MGLFRFTSFRMEIVKAFDSWLDSFTLAHPMSNKDPNVLLNWGTPWVPIGTVILYVFLVFTLPNLLGKKTLRLKWIVPLWNLGLSAFSFCVFWGVLLPYLQIYYDHGFYTGFCGDADIFFGKPSRMLYWIYVFDLSKFAELFDTLFLILRGKRVAFLHWFHHATFCCTVGLLLFIILELGLTSLLSMHLSILLCTFTISFLRLDLNHQRVLPL